MEHFRVRPLTEGDIDGVVTSAGGRRAHPAADARARPGADYVLADALIELKCLDDEGLAKRERQAKLARLFRPHHPQRPVIVLDRRTLPDPLQREYDRILQGPIKTAVAKATKQLKQSRAEHRDTTCNVLLVINNGYTALDHESLTRMVAHRARQDTREIDAVVVAGCYFYSDTFDSYFLWPISCIPINLDRPFRSYEGLRGAWNGFVESFMTKVVCGEMPADTIKGPVIDTQFEHDGVTYVKPVPPMGKKSDFFIRGRPRTYSSGLRPCPTVAYTFPDMTRDEWTRFRADIPGHLWQSDVYEDWQRERAECCAAATPLKPSVPMPVTHEGWRSWRGTVASPRDIGSVAMYANELFERQVRSTFEAANKGARSRIVPSRYILVSTQEIGQDRANDVSFIDIVLEIPGRLPAVRTVVANARIFHERALMLGCAYAVAERVEIVLWQKDRRYAWV